MFASTLALLSISIFGAAVSAQDSAAVVCIAGQCVEGFTSLARKFLGLNSPVSDSNLVSFSGNET